MNQTTARRLVLTTKALLSSNVYMGAFFPMLMTNGYSRGALLVAIAIGVKAMIAGDFLSSIAVDAWGAKIPVILGALTQTVAIALLPFCHGFPALVAIELLIGLSFPVILGADSKWLRKLDGMKLTSERLNQGVLFFSQTLSALTGFIFLRTPEYAFYLSALLYSAAALISCFLPSVEGAVGRTSAGAFCRAIGRGIRAVLKPDLILNAVTIGVMGIAPWALQYVASSIWTGNDFAPIAIQTIVCMLSLCGVLFAKSLPIKWASIGTALVLSVVGSIYTTSTWGLVAALFLGLIARGAVAVKAREKLFGSWDHSQPVAVANFSFNAISRVAQAAALAFVTLKFN